jgi:hypothetical protein
MNYATESFRAADVIYFRARCDNTNIQKKTHAFVI